MTFKIVLVCSKATEGFFLFVLVGDATAGESC